MGPLDAIVLGQASDKQLKEDRYDRDNGPTSQDSIERGTPGG
jgi:hypothetical protein